MRWFTALCILMLACLSGCGSDAGPRLSVSDVRLLAPIPGSRAGVGYMRLHNGSREPITVRSATSAEFARVEFHETTIENGVSRMRPVSEIVVDAGADLVLEPGGLHMMLIEPLRDVAAGTQVTVEIAHDGGMLFIVATLQDRVSDS